MSYDPIWRRRDLGKRSVAAILSLQDGGNWLAGVSSHSSIRYPAIGSYPMTDGSVLLCKAMAIRGKPFDPTLRAPLHVWAYQRSALRCAECIAYGRTNALNVYFTIALSSA